MQKHKGVMWWVIVSLALSQSPQSSAVNSPVQVSCKDVNGLSVDWFVLYKAPSQKKTTGLEYIYIDSAGKSAMKGQKLIKYSDSALGHTLQPMLSSVRNMAPSFGFLSYSDQPPGASAKTDKFGHSKGVVMGDSSTNTALWLSHSTPQFPYRRDQNNFWPPNKKENGQTFLCVSLAFSELSTVGNHLQNIQAYPFDYDLPNNFPKELKDAANWVTSESLWGKFQDLPSRGDKELKTMAKPVDPTHTEAKDADLYVMLATHFNSDMNAQTWGCQQGRDESFCDTDMHNVMNVEDIRTELGSWSDKQDHSKWAVTTKQNIGWTCFGDLNRATSQYKRYGGAVCINDKTVNQFFKDYVTKVQDCGQRSTDCDSDVFLLGVELEMLELVEGNSTAPLFNGTIAAEQDVMNHTTAAEEAFAL